MTIGQSHGAIAAFAALILCANVPSHGQSQRSGGGETQKFMQQYQQMAAEKTALQAQVAQIKKDLDAANAELTGVKKERDAAKAHFGIPPAALRQANSGKEAAERNLEQSKQRMTELVSRFREAATNFKEVEADRGKLRKDLAERDGALDACAVDNTKLYELTSEVLDRYEHVGLFTKVSAAEPFTKITRTRLENLAEEYREKAQALQVKKAAAP